MGPKLEFLSLHSRKRDWGSQRIRSDSSSPRQIPCSRGVGYVSPLRNTRLRYPCLLSSDSSRSQTNGKNIRKRKTKTQKYRKSAEKRQNLSPQQKMAAALLTLRSLRNRSFPPSSFISRFVSSLCCIQIHSLFIWISPICYRHIWLSVLFLARVLYSIADLVTLIFVPSHFVFVFGEVIDMFLV